MAVYTWPSAGGKAYWPAAVAWRGRFNTKTMVSSLSGYTQTGNVPGSKWALSLDFPKQTHAERRALEGWFAQLAGVQHRASMFDPAQPVPRGSCNLSGVTVLTAAAQFATSLQLANCGYPTTLLAGDQIGVITAGGGQLLKVVADAASSVIGTMTVEVRHMLRAAVAINSAVTLDRPRLLCILADPDLAVPYGANNTAPPFSVDFIEVFA